MPDATQIQPPWRQPRHWRETLRTLHRWLGLVACLPLALQAATGIALAVSENWLATPPAARSVVHAGPQAPSHSLSEIIVAAAAYAEPRHLGQLQMVFMPAPDRPATVRLSSGVWGRDMLQVDTRTLDVRKNASLISTIHGWHERLLMPQGHAIVGVFGALLAFFGVSGVILWWPAGLWRRAFAPPAAGHYRQGGYRAWYGWHLLLGGASSAMALLVAFTGMSMAFGIPGNAVTAIEATAPDFPKLASAGRLTLDQAAAEALAAVPGSRLRSAVLPRGKNGLLRLDLVPAGKARPGAVSTSLTIDMASGKIASAGRRALDGESVSATRFIHALHSGNGFNPVWQAVVFGYGLVLFIMSATGMLMWLRRPRRPASHHPTRPAFTSSSSTASTSPLRSTTDA